MNIVLTSLLKKHCNDFMLTGSDAEKFEHFINYLVVKNHLPQSFDPEVICTKEGEVGIDGIAIILEDTIVTSIEEAKDIFAIKKRDISAVFIFIQAKTSAKFDASEISLFFRTIRSFFNRSSKLNNTPQLKKMKEIISYIFDNSEKLRGNPQVKICFASTGTWKDDNNLSDIVNSSISEMKSEHIFSDIQFIPYDSEKITEAFRLIKNSICKKLPMEQAAIIPATDNVEEAYIGVVKCIDYLKLITDNDGNLMTSLFEDNVRYFQGFNPVNCEISSTLSSETKQKDFAFYNNGITIVANEISRTGSFFNLTDFQVVNGCQTSFVLFSQKQYITPDAFIVVKLVEAKNNDFSSSIVKASNRQTPVTSEAFEILREFHKNLEEAYNAYPSEFRLYYERRSKQYDSVDINRGKIVTLSVQVFSYVAMFLDEPQSTHRYYGELLASNRSRIFRDDDVLDQYCIAAMTLYCTEQWLKKHHYELKYKYHIILLIRNLIDPTPMPLPNSKKMKSLCTTLFETIKDDNKFGDAMQKALAIIEEAKELAANKGFDINNLARSKEFTTILLELCGGTKEKNIPAKKILKEGDIVNCTVKHLNWCFVYVDINDGMAKGQIHISELSDNYTFSVSDRVKIGDRLQARILTNEQHPDYGFYLSLRHITK